jgi:hypothetical protein
MEPEGSSPYSQEPSTGPYPEQDRPSPFHPILSLVRSILILSIHLRLGLPSGLFHYLHRYITFYIYLKGNLIRINRK